MTTYKDYRAYLIRDGKIFNRHYQGAVGREIAAEFGISRSRVHQIIAKAYRYCRSMKTKFYPDCHMCPNLLPEPGGPSKTCEQCGEQIKA